MSSRGTAARSRGGAHHATQSAAPRTALVNRLRAARGCALVTLVAPPGYGKTTLLSQWAERDPRPFTWIAGDRGSRGVSGLVESVAAVLREPADDSLEPATLERVARAWTGVGKPAVLVFDDVHLLRDDETAAVSRLIAATPTGSLVVLSGRALPRLADPSLPLLRATGRLVELGADELALSRREAGAALKAFGVTVADTELTALFEKTEGWPAGIHQAAAMLPTGSAGSRNGFRASNATTFDFFQDECLAALAPEERSFLRRTSVLDRMCGALCDATLDTTGSARTLESLAATSVFLVPIDRRGEWFRYHHLLRESLRQELAGHEPELLAGLHQRAAAWLERHGDSRGALRHAHMGGNREHFMRIFGTAALAEYNGPSPAGVQGWLAELDDELLSSDCRAAVVAARLHAHSGDLAKAQRCLAAASETTDDDVLTGAAIALTRAALCENGAEAMLADTEHALEVLPASDGWRPYGLLLQGVACQLLGEDERAAAILSGAVVAAQRLEEHDTTVIALGESSVLAAARGSWDEADGHLLRACGRAEEHGLEQHPAFALVLALAARTHLRNGLWNDAQVAIARAQRLLPALTWALPWLAVQARLELTAAFVMLRDAPSAHALLAQVDEILTARPDLGQLQRHRDRVAADVTAIPAGHDGQTVRLSRAELRLLPLLGTHLSFREIGAHLFLSRHTVKTQAISAYRKLGASSRREAVVEAARLALIESPADLGAFSS
jgi:LuxR family transcriptional regulator, maltose regulon positive regulatory protein